MTDIFVGNLPFKVCETDLRRTFERYGRVASVRIMTDPKTNNSRGFAFVRMPYLDDADEAIKRLSGITMQGRRLTVNESRDARADQRPAESQGENSHRSAALQFFDALCAPD